MKAMHTKRNGLENHHPISHGGSLSFQELYHLVHVASLRLSQRVDL
jgi:hypothetical protein